MNRKKVYLRQLHPNRIRLGFLAMVLCLFGIPNMGMAQQPNCVNLNLSVGPNDSVSFTVEEMVPNGTTVDITIKNAFGATVFAQTGMASADVIEFAACNLIGQKLTVDVENSDGICWSELTIKQGASKTLSSNLTCDSVWCIDPIIGLDPNDLENVAWYTMDSPYTILPTASIACREDIAIGAPGDATFEQADRNNDGEISAEEARDWYAPRFEDCEYYAVDWTNADFACDEDISKMIIREWEAYDKEGNRTSIVDTIIVFKLPQLSAANINAPEKDTVHCFLDTMISTDVDPSYVCWKEIVGLHSDSTVVSYPKATVDTLLAEAGRSPELQAYLDDIVVIFTTDANGNPLEIRLADFTSAPVRANNTLDLYEYTVKLGDRFLSNNGTYITADENWFYQAGEHGYWVDLCLPSAEFERSFDVCDRWEEWVCETGPQVVLPNKPYSTDTCVSLCLTDDILSASKCYTVLHSEIKELSSSCPRIVKKHFEIKQTCMAVAAAGTLPGNCGITVDGSGVDDTDPNFIIVEQWKMYIDTIGPLIRSTNNVTHWSTGVKDCNAHVTVNPIFVKDDCSGVKEVKARILYNGAQQGSSVSLVPDEDNEGYWVHPDGARTIPLALGGPYVIEYIALDSCHNADTANSDQIYVWDEIAPTVITQDELNVTLSGGEVWIDADRFDAGSTDNCGIREIYVRRTDWADACGVDLCPSDAITGVTTEAELDAYIRENGLLATLEAAGVEEFYNEAYTWIRDDGNWCIDDPVKPQPNYLLASWEQAIKEYLAENCIDADIELEETFSIGGGWGTALPICCADACDQVEVEVLVIDAHCNYSIGTTLINVNDNSSVSRAQDFDDVNISCNAYQSLYEDIIQAAVAKGSGTSDTAEFAALDEAFGAFALGFRGDAGSLVDADGNELDLTFTYQNIVSRDTTIGGVDTIVFDTIDVSAEVGAAFIQCGSSVTQSITGTVGDCGTGTFTRTFSVTGGCNTSSSSAPMIFTQQIIIEAEGFDESLFAFPPAEVRLDIGASTALPFGDDGNLSLNSGQITYLGGGESCLQLAIGYQDEVLEIVQDENGDTAQFKVHRDWTISEWCSEQELTYQQKLIITAGGIDPSDFTGGAGGQLSTVENGTIGNVEVLARLEDGTTISTMSGIDGSFAISDIPEGEPYLIQPVKDINPLNGVDILDIIAIQRHILGLDPIEDKFLRIAADVNNDGRINGVDMIAIQQVTLQKEDRFPNNTSWRFFNEITGEESYHVSENQGQMTVDFTGVKVGDINMNGTDLSRTANAIELVAEDMALIAGDQHQITFSAESAVQAYQMVLRYDESKIDVVSITHPGLTEDNWNKVADGEIRISYVGDDIAEMSVAVIAREDVNLADAIAISSEVDFPAVAVVNETTPAKLGLSFEHGNDFELFQNVPNPASDLTSIRFHLPEASNVTFTVFDVAGKVLLSRESSFESGMNVIELSTDELGASGVMFYQLDTEQFSETRRMVIIQ